jgi:hypothetical protein
MSVVVLSMQDVFPKICISESPKSCTDRITVCAVRSQKLCSSWVPVFHVHMYFRSSVCRIRNSGGTRRLSVTILVADDAKIRGYVGQIIAVRMW